MKRTILGFLIITQLIFPIYYFIIINNPTINATVSEITLDRPSLMGINEWDMGWANVSVISDDLTSWNNDASRDPAIAIDRTGTLHVVWQDHTDGEWGVDSEIFYANFSKITGWSNATAISGIGENAWNSGESSYPAIAVDSFGQVHVVWSDDTPGNWGIDSEIFYTKYLLGVGWSNATAISGVNLNSWNNGSSTQPSIAVNGEEVHVVWADNTPGPWGADYDIFYMNYTPSTGWSNATPITGVGVNNWSSDNSFRPRIGIDALGDIHVVWIDFTDGEWGVDTEIHYIKYSKGVGWSNATAISGVGINSWNSGHSSAPNLAVDGMNLHVVWYDNTPGPWGTDFEIFYMNYTPEKGWSNASVISGTGVNSWNTMPSYLPDIAVDQLGIIHVVWQDATPGEWGTDSEIMYSKYLADLGWSNATVISDDASNWNDDASTTPAIVVDALGRAHVVWSDDTNGPWGFDQEIMYTSSAPVIGSWVWNTEIVLTNPKSGLVETPSMRLDSLGRPYIVSTNHTDSPFDDDLVLVKWNGTDWETEKILEDPSYSPAIALDSSDRPHIAFETGSSIYYTKWNGSAWELTPVDTVGSCGDYISIVMDSLDHAHIAYYETNTHDLRYAKWNGTVWNTEVVDETLQVGRFNAIDIDSNDYPHISYWEHTTQALRYAKWNGTGWEIEILDSDDEVGQYTSIVVDSLDRPYISYIDSTNHELMLAYKKGGEWVFETIDSDQTGKTYTSICLDSDESPYIAYNSYYLSPPFPSSLKLARWNGIEWIIGIINNDTNDIGSLVLALDSSNTPKIVYKDASNNLLKYAKGIYINSLALTHPIGGNTLYIGELNEINWHSINASSVNLYLYKNQYGINTTSLFYRTIATGINADYGKYEWDVPLDLDSSSFYKIKINSTVGEDISDWSDFIRIAPKRGWFSERIGGKDLGYIADGNYSSIVIDSNDSPHISYSDKVSGFLWYAYFDRYWHYQIVDNSPNVGYFSSIDLDSKGYPYISYEDKTNGDLKCAHWNGTHWEIETVDDMGVVGKYTSIALDTLDRPHIAYYDSTNKDLKYARWTGALWFISTVDSGGDVGYYASLALDTNDRPHISYQNNTALSLKYAYYNGSGWEIQVVDGNDHRGYYSSLELDSLDRPHIAYRCGSGLAGIWYAKWDGSKWNFERVTFWIQHKYISLALDKLDRAHISYFNDVDDDLEYVTWNGTGWNHQIIDTGGYVGRCNSIAVDSKNLPHISYYETYYNIVYARLMDCLVKPSPPRDLALTIKEGNVELTWKSPEDNGGLPIIEYRVYRGLNAGNETYLVTIGGDERSYLDAKILNNLTYYYYVTAVNSLGQSNASNEVNNIAINNPIILIDDDGNKDYQKYFTQALDDKGYAYKIWNYSRFGSPSLDILLSHDLVVWTTGAETVNTLSSADQITLMQYLDSAGRLYLSAQSFIFEINGGADGTVSNIFINDYLHISAVDNSVAYTSIEGVNNDPITDIFGVLSLNYPFNNYASEITLNTADNNASPIFTNPSGGAVTANKVDSGTYKLVFSAFSFEALANQSATDGANFLNNTITWLLLPPNDTIPPTANAPLGANYPANSTNDYTLWILSDNYAGGYYRVLLNKSEYISWTPWISGNNLTIPVATNNGFGFWNYTLQYNDSLGNWGIPAVVFILIFDDTPPWSNSPGINACPANSTGNTIDWELYDNKAPGFYKILLNNSEYLPWDTWENTSNLAIPVNTNIGLGAWNYTILYNDSVGLNGLANTVIVTIFDNTSPTSNSPPSTTATYNRFASIEWILTDNLAGGFYRVWLNETEYISWQPWTSGSSIYVPINTTKNLGPWNYTIEYEDLENNAGIPSTVIITIVDDLAPTSNTPLNASYGMNSTGKTIDWVLTDNYAPGYYRILLNTAEYLSWDTWDNESNLLIPVLTDIGLGVWNYTIEYNDSLGNQGVPHSVFIRVIDDVAPQSNTPPNVTYLYATPANITWILTDNVAPGYYRVLRAGLEYQSWQQWANNSPLVVDIDTYSLGIWTYTIQYNDSYGIEGVPNNVIITIEDITPPWSSQPPNNTYEINEFKFINWTLYDNAEGGWYQVLENGSPYTGWNTWSNGFSFQTEIDTSSFGYLNYTIQYFDSQGLWGIPTTVIICINDQTAPYLTYQPPDDSVVYGNSYLIFWQIYENGPGGYYSILKNDTLIVTNMTYSTVWSPFVSISYSINTNTLGNWNYTIIYRDIWGWWGIPDSVLITVYDDQKPTADNPPDAIYPIGALGKTINWTLMDNIAGGDYRIFRNGIVYTPWNNWTSGIPIEIPIATTEAGVWSYTIEYKDSWGLTGVPDTVFITIYDEEAPYSNTPPNADYLIGTSGATIDWILSDNSAGGNYHILRNSTEYRPWTSWRSGVGLNVQIDTSILGVWNYTIEYYDSGEIWGISHSVIITIYDNVSPNSNNPPDTNVGEKTSGAFINWVLYDLGGGGYYQILINGTEYIPWTPWISGVSLIIPIDTFRGVGTWNYTIEFYDSAGVWGLSNSVMVTISELGAISPEPSGTDPLLIIVILVAGIAIAAAIVLHALIRRKAPSAPPLPPKPKKLEK